MSIMTERENHSLFRIHEFCVSFFLFIFEKTMQRNDNLWHTTMGLYVHWSSLTKWNDNNDQHDIGNRNYAFIQDDTFFDDFDIKLRDEVKQFIGKPCSVQWKCHAFQLFIKGGYHVQFSKCISIATETRHFFLNLKYIVFFVSIVLTFQRDEIPLQNKKNTVSTLFPFHNLAIPFFCKENKTMHSHSVNSFGIFFVY